MKYEMPNDLLIQTYRLISYVANKMISYELCILSVYFASEERQKVLHVFASLDFVE